MTNNFDNGLFAVVKISDEKYTTIVGTRTTGSWGVYNNETGKLIVTQGKLKTAINVANQLADEKFLGV